MSERKWHRQNLPTPSYFVANQALLDILSNGNRPLKVAVYLGDVFDGVNTLNCAKS